MSLLAMPNNFGAIVPTVVLSGCAVKLSREGYQESFPDVMVRAQVRPANASLQFLRALKVMSTQCIQM